MKRLGVISTLVWDVIYRREDLTPVEDWGGATYSLSALDASLDANWEIVPIVKVGRDRAEAAASFLASLVRMSGDAPRIVDEPNNASELRYVTDETRTERLSGRVPAWTWDELRAELLRSAPDALYVNFLSGWEIDLDTAKALRAAFDGPIYADIHMMVWKPAAGGRRTLTPIVNLDEWLACFDYVQVNEDEMRTIAGDEAALVSRAHHAGVRFVAVTYGKSGVHWWMPSSSGESRPSALVEGAAADPTGCGDVWGATLFARILSGDSLERALDRANRAAHRNASHRGVRDLARILRD